MSDRYWGSIMTEASASEAEKPWVRTDEYVSGVTNWKNTSKASICACLLALSPVGAALAQTTGSSSSSGDNGYVAPAAASGDAGASASGVAPAAPAAAAPAAASASASSSSAAVSAPTTNLGNVAVTGTAIARTDAATSLPVTVYKASDLRKQGITSTPQLLQQLAGNDSSSGPGFGTGAQNTGGASFADLRGLGPNKTLILLNGRRLAVNGLFGNGSGTDLNSIPFAAIDRVEVLRSGASALYGTDAVGGVINFITKKNLQGGDVSLQETLPTRSGGGNGTTLSATFGKGDLDKDGWNIMGTLEYRRQQAVNANDRSFVTPLDPRIDAVSSFTYPGQYVANPNYNPTAPGCNVHGEVSIGDSVSCRENYTALGANVVDRSNEPSAYLRGAYKINDNNKVSLSYLWTRNTNYTLSAPSPTVGNFGSSVAISPSSPYYPGNGVVPLPTTAAEGAGSFDPTQPAQLRYRAVPLGPRIARNVNQSQRAVMAFTGRFLGGFHYDTALNFDQSTTTQNLVSGFFNQAYGANSFQTAVNDGSFNPFTSNPTPAQLAKLRSLETTGELDQYRTRAYIWDGKVDHELGNWFGAGQAALALGAQYRHETLSEYVNGSVAERATSEGIEATQINKKRDVESVFGELNIPLLKNLSLDAQARFDNYSDVGTTTNPKVSLRYQPFKMLVLRAHYAEGFHAPTLYDLYQPPSVTNSSGGLNDPLRCPGGTPIAGANASVSCNQQFNEQIGGNKNLQPETSQSWGAGFVLQPIKYVSLSADFWHIRITNLISVPPDDYIFSHYSKYANEFHRNGSGGPINYISDLNQNLGAITTSGEDVDLKFNLPTDTGDYTLALTGTYTNYFEQQVVPGGKFISNVGRYANDQVEFRWKHNITLGWSKGPWALAVVNHYESGYRDSGGDRQVHPFITWDTYGSYSFHDGVQITLGSDNVFDKNPPFSVQTYAGNSGYDARYASGLGRTVYGRLSYDF
ncbi:TonB-dependent receptor [Salinisphaera sp. LB1]|uniref:TonB-dependent receptor n=1 Tax=Salinisphaera sp. LB1 TaxID=2183911 RepID=UPI000D706418|nr:TonB-dependent receptor [Salinisphaera sp. LB1]AWN16261.1 Outer membrane receptor protein, mostly Fe transport [Salinisphaera sp. LB1]